MTSANLVDRIVGYFSPEAGMRRAQARAATRVLGSYDGARIHRRTSGWMTTGASANAVIGQDITKLRERSRDLIRNNALASRALLEWRTRTVGEGIIPRWQNQAAQMEWNRFSRQCSSDGLPHFEAIQDLVAATVFESGECFVRFRYRRTVGNPLQLQVLEPEFVDFEKNGVLGDNYVIQGVEFNRIGERVAYWVFGQHPGEAMNLGVRDGVRESKRVPANQIIHIYEATRPGQVRGVPKLSAAMLRMRDLDDWLEAEIVRKKSEACLMGFRISPEGDIALGPREAETSGEIVEEFVPGMIASLKTGEDIKFNQPAHSGGFYEAVRTYEMDIAAAIGMPYEVLTGNLSHTNYSSYRSGLIAYKRIIGSFQWNVLIPRLCQRVAEEFAALYGVAGAPQWAPPEFELLDRLNESEADQLELQIGTRTWAQAVAAKGYDPDQQLAEIEKFNERLKKAGVTFAQGGKVDVGQEDKAAPKAGRGKPNEK